MVPERNIQAAAVTAAPLSEDRARFSERFDAAPTLPLVEARDLQVKFPNRARTLLDRRQRYIKAVDGVSLEIRPREVLSLVGESGSGKTTVGRAILGLVPISGGTVTFDGVDMTASSDRELKDIRRRMQVVFQDPYASLHPRFRIGRILEEPLKIQHVGEQIGRRARVSELLELVGLEPSAADRFPHQFSGGQRQRIAIARALALDPDFIVADEPVSALDVSIQAQILNLLKRLQRDRRLAMLVISHDLAVVRHVSDHVAVMYLGRLVEIAPINDLFAQPSHPYTIALISAVPRFGAKQQARQRRIVLEGDLPSPSDPPHGCRFHTRCWLRERLGRPSECTSLAPALRRVGPGHVSGCHFAEEAVARWRSNPLP
jgi:oligopeptide/dipeptide ABC transporter ATP-binding protein